MRQYKRQRAKVVVDIHAALERHLEKRCPIAGKRIRLHRLALDDARVAIRRFAARRTAVHKRHRMPALRQMQRGAGADHAGAENQDVSFHVVDGGMCETQW